MQDSQKKSSKPNLLLRNALVKEVVIRSLWPIKGTQWMSPLLFFSRKGIAYSYFYCLSAIWQISFRWMYCMLTFQGILLCQSSLNLQLHFLFLFMKIKQYIQITVQFQVVFPSFIKVRNNANYTVLTILRIIKILGMHYLLWYL